MWKSAAHVEMERRIRDTESLERVADEYGITLDIDRFEPALPLGMQIVHATEARHARTRVSSFRIVAISSRQLPEDSHPSPDSISAPVIESADTNP